MAFNKIVFENPNTGHTKEAPVGFSWTVLLFGFFPPLIRGDWKWTIIILITGIITMGFSTIIFMFIYNKLYIKDLLSSGFKAKSIEIGTFEDVSQKIGIDLPII